VARSSRRFELLLFVSAGISIVGAAIFIKKYKKRQASLILNK